MSIHDDESFSSINKEVEKMVGLLDLRLLETVNYYGQFSNSFEYLDDGNYAKVYSIRTKDSRGILQLDILFVYNPTSNLVFITIRFEEDYIDLGDFNGGISVDDLIISSRKCVTTIMNRRVKGYLNAVESKEKILNNLLNTLEF